MRGVEAGQLNGACGIHEVRAMAESRQKKHSYQAGKPDGRPKPDAAKENHSYMSSAEKKAELDTKVALQLGTEEYDA